MTLHWWMHWFWVTMLLITFASIGMAIAVPQSVEVEQISTEAEVDPLRHAERQSRALYFSKTTQATTKLPLANKTETNQTEKNQTKIDKNQTKTDKNQTKTAVDTKQNVTIANTTEIVHPSVVQWTPVNATDLTITNKTTNLTKPLNTTSPIYTNLTDVHNTTSTRKKNVTRLQVKEESSVEGISESRIVTEKPLSLETTFLQTRIPPNVESSRRVIDNENGMDTGAIAGISFAALVLAALAGSTAFVLYRRRYLNKPQTLNDKCSNPDSSGYLDDSTVRDNSEEMYSLDNDSFLNSLEAMTIQNYWTDTVKHTKL